MGFVRSGIVMAAFALGALLPCAPAQQKESEDAAAAPKEQMFSGEVTAMDENSLTATRTGAKDSQTFTITPGTKFEGKPKVKSRVTIRYVVTDDGARALRVIVRAPAGKK